MLSRGSSASPRLALSRPSILRMSCRPCPCSSLDLTTTGALQMRVRASWLAGAPPRDLCSRAGAPPAESVLLLLAGRALLPRLPSLAALSPSPSTTHTHQSATSQLHPLPRATHQFLRPASYLSPCLPSLSSPAALSFARRRLTSLLHPPLRHLDTPRLVCLPPPSLLSHTNARFSSPNTPTNTLHSHEPRSCQRRQDLRSVRSLSRWTDGRREGGLPSSPLPPSLSPSSPPLRARSLTPVPIPLQGLTIRKRSSRSSARTASLARSASSATPTARSSATALLALSSRPSSYRMVGLFFSLSRWVLPVFLWCACVIGRKRKKPRREHGPLFLAGPTGHPSGRRGKRLLAVGLRSPTALLSAHLLPSQLLSPFMDGSFSAVGCRPKRKGSERIVSPPLRPLSPPPLSPALPLSLPSSSPGFTSAQAGMPASQGFARVKPGSQRRRQAVPRRATTRERRDDDEGARSHAGKARAREGGTQVISTPPSPSSFLRRHSTRRP